MYDSGDVRFDLWAGPVLHARARMTVEGLDAVATLRTAERALHDAKYRRDKSQVETALRHVDSPWHALALRRGSSRMNFWLSDGEFLPWELIPGVREKVQIHHILLATRDMELRPVQDGTASIHAHDAADSSHIPSCEFLFQANVEHGSVNVRRFSRQAISLIVRVLESHGATVSSLVAIQKEDIPLDSPLDTKTFVLLEREERRIARAERKTRRR